MGSLIDVGDAGSLSAPVRAESRRSRLPEVSDEGDNAQEDVDVPDGVDQRLPHDP